MEYTYEPEGICPQRISFRLDGNVVTNIKFYGGCNGNLKLIAKMVDGWTVEQIDALMRGHECGNRGTSCADQLAAAVYKAYRKSTRGQQ